MASHRRTCEEARLRDSTDLKLGPPILASGESSDRDSSQGCIYLAIGYRLGVTPPWCGLNSYQNEQNTELFMLLDSVHFVILRTYANDWRERKTLGVAHFESGPIRA